MDKGRGPMPGRGKVRIKLDWQMGGGGVVGRGG